MMPRIFISHSYSDSSTAKALSKALSEHGLETLWVDTLEPGSEVAKKLGNALRSAGWYVVLVSEESLKSPNVNFEIGAAMGGKKRVLPVFLTRSARKKASSPLSGFEGILVEGLSPRAIAEKVAQAIEKEAA
jgi:TIR domain-containing protein